MKKILYTIFGAGMLFFNTSCTDFLETKSPSDADVSFVFSDPSTARAALTNAYELWRSKAYVHSNGLFYDLCAVGSDSERHPEAYSAQTRHIPENLYAGGTAGFSIDFSDSSTAWTNLYSIIATTNTLIKSFEASSSFQTYMSAGKPSEMSELYGEAVALRATAYFELCRFFGDVPHQLVAGVSAEGLTSRDEIYEYHINKLIEVEPLMYRVGENATTVPLSMSRTYVQGLIGRMCLYAGGYATRRTDLGANFYKNLKGETLSFTQLGTENNGAVYNRRTDYKTFYETAKIYLAACVANPGSAKLLTADSRSTSKTGQAFGNPYQNVFQEMMNGDGQVSEESIYEIPETYGSSSERPYAFGRPSNGGSKNAYPCKSYGQSRFHPTYYYGDFDPNDMRRDVTVTVTASSGSGSEVMIDFKPSSKSSGGLANNKWDENRMTTPYTAAQRNAGINAPYMRCSDVVLMLAEVYAELGQDDLAKAELRKVHERAFKTAALANVDGFITKCGGIKEAVAQERKLEFGGEGLRRYDLIRTGKLPEAITKLKAQLSAMISGLKANGYYTFENGNTISKYIWTKAIDAKSTFGYRLTTQCTNTSDPVLYPGWRGQNDAWESLGCVYKSTTTNIAIKGLFNYIDPYGTEATALLAAGYKQVDWGKTIVDNENEYLTTVFCGYQEGKAPIYLVPMNSNTISTSNGKITNGYGFAQK
ncbi:RagB/SusD family nutrient uptake outer membrane protein [uncultured Bacteroides sp.]|uniref:RagB/SusD family nutrient uptake outer membrane protein n=1 Tax=uncultured Bacteroides sp. TaxID=162156 RepID=UPI002AAB1ABA|nr:RagB/SusD family nutrient uptake outer membrane protein [uncultured Bacteroides sp.]